jgi:hypothetical protein
MDGATSESSLRALPDEATESFGQSVLPALQGRAGDAQRGGHLDLRAAVEETLAKELGLLSGNAHAQESHQKIPRLELRFGGRGRRGLISQQTLAGEWASRAAKVVWSSRTPQAWAAPTAIDAKGEETMRASELPPSAGCASTRGLASSVPPPSLGLASMPGPGSEQVSPTPTRTQRAALPLPQQV